VGHQISGEAADRRSDRQAKQGGQGGVLYLVLSFVFRFALLAWCKVRVSASPRNGRNRCACVPPGKDLACCLPAAVLQYYAPPASV